MELLKKLCQCPAMCGDEDEIRSLILNEINLEGYTDNSGNLIFHKKGIGSGTVIAAALDTPGAYVTFIDADGFLRFSPMGGFDAPSGTAVRLKGGRTGIISEDKNKEKFIDIGVFSKDEAEQYACISDSIVPAVPVTVSGNCLSAYRAGSRAAVYAVIQAANADTLQDVYFVFVSKCSCNQISPVFLRNIKADRLITAECSSANDLPGEKNVFTALSKGAVIKVKDSSLLSSPAVLKDIYSRTSDIPTQREVSEDKGIGGKLQTAYSGIASAGIGVPVRYKNSLSETVCIDDINSMYQVLLRILK